MSDDRNLRDEMNILFDDLDDFGDAKTEPRSNAGYRDARPEPEEEEFTFEDRGDESPYAKEGARAEEAEEKRRFEMDSDEEEEEEPVRKNTREEPSSADKERQKKYFIIFSVVIGVLTLLAVLFILISRGVFKKNNADSATTDKTTESVTEPATEETDEPDESSREEESESEKESETAPVVNPSVYNITKEKVEATLQPYLDDMSVDTFLETYPRLVIAMPDASLNIRKEPSTDAAIVGILMRGAYANVIADESGNPETSGDWIHIQSGTFAGWVKSDYVRTGDKAVDAAKQFLNVKVISRDGLRVRTQPNASATVIETVKYGTVFRLAKTEAEGGFYQVYHTKNNAEIACYVSSNMDLAKLILRIQTAIEKP